MVWCVRITKAFIASLDKQLGDVPVLFAEPIAIHEVRRMATDRNMDQILIESDLQLVVNSTRDLIKVPAQFVNHVIDIGNLARNFNNIQFSYFDRSQNYIADRIAKSYHYIIVGMMFVYINESISLQKKT